ncbi:MAG: hypothetical protein PF450_13300 [Bacteroidales bacterium]|nr:hypothetical protein [Bacteroidales bacterium]
MKTTLETLPPQDVIDNIEATYLGTPGGLQYHHTTGLDKLKKIKNCHFVILRRAERLMGSIGYVRRETKTGDYHQKTWLIRYFSFKAPLRAKKKAKKAIKKRAVKDRSQSMLKDITHIFHDNPERLSDLDTEEVPKAVIYGLVEKDNDRSRNFAEIGGFSKTGAIESYMFSRLSQRRKIEVEQLQKNDIPAMKAMLEDFYSGHAFYFDEYLFIDNNYFVLRENGEIIAGMQANEVVWEIKTIGSEFLDKIIKFLTRIPMIGKRFKYEEMKFLGIEGMYYKEGHEASLYKLLEGVLAHKDHYLALLIMDVSSPEFKVFNTRKKLGPVNTFLGSFDADIYTKFFSFSEEEKAETLRRPTYVSIYDNT